MIGKSGVVGGWITSRSGWLLELLTELIMGGVIRMSKHDSGAVQVQETSGLVVLITNRSGWLLELLTELKMAIYCPQGSGTLRQQLLMMHGIAWYCIVLHSIAWYCMVLHGIAWNCIVLHGIA